MQVKKKQRMPSADEVKWMASNIPSKSLLVSIPSNQLLLFSNALLLQECLLRKNRQLLNPLLEWKNPLHMKKDVTVGLGFLWPD